LQLPHRDVTFPAADGVRLSGWYVPGTNGAAIVLVHGGGGDREGTIRHARLLAASGYGVLLYDARGRGESEGHENAFGWYWDRDVRGAVDYLEAAGVRHIGLLGLSTGAEAVVTEAASDPRVAAVVSDGLQGRTPGDAGNLGFGNRIAIQPAFAVLSAAIRAVRGERQPAPMLELVHRVAASRPLLLIGTEGFERELDRAYVRGTAAQLWELPDTAHTQGLASHPAAYAARVLTVFDGALRTR
jgi:pimeloyl-ACP methyl ester carboxylesterase